MTDERWIALYGGPLDGQTRLYASDVLRVSETPSPLEVPGVPATEPRVGEYRTTIIVGNGFECFEWRGWL